MNNVLSRATILALSLGILSGCSSMGSYERETFCVAGGALIGGAAGSTSSSEDAAKGAIGGALAGALICHFMDGDADEDGVKDSDDMCPATPLGVAVDAQGCELEIVLEEPVVMEGLDSDMDMVVDANDLCPNTPAGATVDVNGCPVITLDDVTFAFDSSTLSDKATMSLAPQIDLIRNNPNLRMSIVGYTDSTGPAAFNDALSLRRAESVRDFFVQNGVSADTFSVYGEGENNPVASNSTQAGRAMNRRVVISVNP